MKKIVFATFCFSIAQTGFSQDTFTYNTVKASDVTETVVELEGVPQETMGLGTNSFSMASAGRGTVTGATAGALSVSSTGGANYTIPIDVPPGLNGVEPDISLIFDSQSGNGSAGWGWNVSGVSVITRIPATPYHDDVVDAVDFDLLDRFALDGQRLILKTGTYGVDGAIYQTEQYSNIKIISIGSHPDSDVEGPNHFKVLYPDGSIAYYGYTNDSRSPIDYAISYWENPQGLRINYTYNNYGNVLDIISITYGGRGSTSSINEIEFLYGLRGASNNITFINGKEFNRNYILQKVIIKGNSSPYRNYILEHNRTSLKYERLTSIQENSGDNTLSRSAISFSYGDTTSFINETQSDFNNLNIGNIEQRNSKVVSLDISGNGKMDFIVYPTTGVDAKKKFWLFSDFQINGQHWGTEVNTGLFQEIFPVSWLNHDYKLLPNQGLVLIQNGTDNEVKFKVYSSGGAVQPIAYKYEKSWNAPTYKPQDYHLYNNPAILRVPLKYISGDFDGDGLSDVIALEKTYTATYCHEIPASSSPTCSDKVTRNGIEYCCYGCSTSTYSTTKAHLIKLDRRISGNSSSIIGHLGRELKSTDKIFTLDVNGDGKTDILQFREGKVYVYSLNNANNNIELLWQTNDTSLHMDVPILPGDYNGDGKSDFLIPSGVGRFFKLFSSKGNGFAESGLLYEEFSYQSFQDNQGTKRAYNLIPVDINNDGKTDIIDYRTITTDGSSIGTQEVSIYENSGIVFGGNLSYFDFAGSANTTGNLKQFPVPVFLSSNRPNSNMDFASISDNHVTSFELTKDHKEDVSLKQISNNGVVTTIKYDEVNPYYQDGSDPYYSSSYTSGHGQIYPYVNVNVAPSFRVVRELVETGDGIARTRQFLYKGAVSHANGLGFIGFEELKRTNWYGDGVTTLWHISKHDPMLRNAVTEQWTSETSSSIPVQYSSKTDYFYDYTLISNPGSPSAPQYDEFLNLDYGITGQRTDEAEQYINLLPGFSANGSNGTYLAKIVPPNEQPGAQGYAGVTDIRLKRIENDNGLTGVFTTETYTYDQYNNPVTTIRTFPGGSETKTFQYSNNESANDYNYHIGRLTKKTESSLLNGNSFSTEEQYAYNNNLVSETRVKGNGTSWLTITFQYDQNGNVLQKTSNGDGVATRTESYEYVGYGERFLTKSTDMEGLVTRYTYEPETGNLLTTTDPYGLVTTFAYDSWNRLEKETDYLNNETVHAHIPQTGGGLKKTTDYPTGAKEETVYNAFGWVTRNGTLSLDNQWTYKSFEYDVSGRNTKVSEPHNGSASQWNTVNFDPYGRVISQLLYTGRTINITYSGLSSTVNDGVKTVTTTKDALGNTVAVNDPGGTIDYTYYGNGSLKTVDYGGNLVSVGIDGWGRKTSLNDPAAGTYTYSYNNYGELLEEATPKGTTTYVYDDYGKPVSKETIGDLTDLLLTYQYDNTTKLLTHINGQDNTNNRVYTYQYSYDSYKRPSTIKENTGLAEFELQYTYDTYGRVYKETRISKNGSNAVSKTLTTRNVYDASGILSEIWNDGTPDKLWELDQINARGQALAVNLGNGMVKTKIYDAYGYVTKIEDKESGTDPTVALHTEYDFNVQRGTLNDRENFGFNWQENFGYDNLDRLTTITGDITKTMAFDSKGRIDSNTDIGSYTYANSSNKYRLTEITPNSSGDAYFQAHPTQQIAYNAFKKPVTIHESGHGRVDFEYGPLMNRTHAYYGGEDEDKLLRRYRKHYSAIIAAEIVEDTQTGSTKIITYVGGDAYTAPVAHIKQTGTGVLDEYHYLHRDYLGSILAVTDADGDVKEERQFGAWGSVDKFLDSAGNTTFGHSGLLGRGYTGHEHFFEVSLIHMNGRMYDAQLGKFLSPDNFVQDPFNTQNYNRYGYVLNNPLMYTDTSGEFLEFLFGSRESTGNGGGGLLGSILGGLVWLGNTIFGNHDANPYDAPYANSGTVAAPGNNQNNYDTFTLARGNHPEFNFDLPNIFSGEFFDKWLVGSYIGHRNFIKNTVRGITEGIPRLLRSNLRAFALMSVGQTRSGLNIYFGNQVNMAKGAIVSPIMQTVDAFTLFGRGDTIGAAANFAEVGDGVALSLAGYGVGRGISGLSGMGRVAKTSMKALPSGGRTVKHHIFNVFRGKSPKSQVYRDFFKKHGIDLDAHTVHIPENLHRQIHSAGNNWTTSWKRWIDANPNATTKQVYQRAGQMMDGYGISGYPILPYK